MIRRSSGFTLIEILLVVGILAVLASVVFVALDPAKRFREARDARRTSDVQSILTAIHTYIIDNRGSIPAGLDTTERQLGTATSGCAIATGGCTVTGTSNCLNLATPLAKYLKSMPIDPNGGTAALTQYSIVIDANSIITVRACGTEGASPISVSQ